MSHNINSKISIFVRVLLILGHIMISKHDMDLRTTLSISTANFGSEWHDLGLCRRYCNLHQHHFRWNLALFCWFLDLSWNWTITKQDTDLRAKVSISTANFGWEWHNLGLWKGQCTLHQDLIWQNGAIFGHEIKLNTQSFHFRPFITSEIVCLFGSKYV